MIPKKLVLNLNYTLLGLAAAAAYSGSTAAATSAGIAQFTAGDVSLKRPDGSADPLVKGKDIESGQAIVTGATGRAQLKFSDGGVVSLQPNTEFKIVNYVDKLDAKEDRFLVDLLRGGMRAITGLIGKRNNNNYRVTTTTATIGIRGSGFAASYNPDGSMNVTAEKDAIEVCSGGVCIGLVAGESAIVRSSSEPPVRTSIRASISTPPPAQEVVTIGNQTNADGSSSLIAVVGQTLIDRTLSDIKVIAVATETYQGYQYVSQISSENPTTTEFRNNKLLKFTDQSEGTRIFSEAGTAQPVANFRSIGNVTDPDFVGWGMWTMGTKVDGSTVQQLDNFHYVAGRPTSQADMTAFLSSCNYCTYNYALVGSTAPTQNGVAGILNSASFGVMPYYGYYSLNIAINTSFGNYSGNSYYASGSSFSNVEGTVKGSFFGSNAGRAGLTYGFDPAVAGSGTVKGALVFQKPASSSPSGGSLYLNAQ